MTAVGTRSNFEADLQSAELELRIQIFIYNKISYLYFYFAYIRESSGGNIVRFVQ